MSISDRPMRPAVTKKTKPKHKDTPSFNKVHTKSVVSPSVVRFSVGSKVEKKVVPKVRLSLEHSPDGRLVVRSAKKANI